MRRVLPIILLIGLLILFLSIRALLFESKPTHEISGPVLAPLPVAPVLANEASSGRVQVKQPPQANAKQAKTLHARQSNFEAEGTEQLLDRASKNVLSRSKPALAPEAVTKTDVKSSKWLARNMRHARIQGEVKGEPIPDLCDTEACQKSQDGYTLVGVVVSTSPTQRNHFSGDVAQGDAKRTPLLHLK